jgi:hypothetical protein
MKTVAEEFYFEETGIHTIETILVFFLMCGIYLIFRDKMIILINLTFGLANQCLQEFLGGA